MEKAQITVFLSLIFTLLLSVLCTAAEGIRVHALELEGQLALQAGMNAVLSEYDKDLLEMYDIFYVNGGSKNGTFSSERIEEKVAEYITCNLNVSKGGTIKYGGNLLQGRLNLTEVGNFVLATDGTGQDFFSQAVDYVKKKWGFDFVEKLLGQAKASEIYWDLGEEVESKIKEKKQELTKLEEENRETEHHFEQRYLDELDALSQKEEYEAEGVLGLIMGEKKISGRRIDIKELPSNRQLLTGYGKEEGKTIEEKLLFTEYLLEKFSHVLDDRKEKELNYEVEYILTGGDSDEKNLEGVIDKLLLFREGVNYLYLHSDASKVAQAEGLATTLVGFTGLPPVVLVVRELLLLSWAYGESISDVKNLMEGGTLALIKTSENWQLELENVGRIFDTKTEVRKESFGLSYKEYLRVLLIGMSEDTLTMRALDLMEMNMRQKEGKEQFRIDCCFSSFQCHGFFQSKPMFLTIPFQEGMLKKEEGTYELEKKAMVSY